ncbi:MAG: HAD family hydrolase [Planctomycetota bacterium]
MASLRSAATGTGPGDHSFDLVVLDLEGTLVTGRRPERAVWLSLAPEAERDAWRAGLAAWEASGSPAIRAVEFFSGVPSDARAEWVERFEAECAGLCEHRGLWLMPGVGPALSELRASGARLAIATYAGPGAVQVALESLGLGEQVEAQRCLDGRGPDDKAAMLADLCVEFGTRSAVLVGDSRSDADAAFRAGLPFVALAPEQLHAKALGTWSELPASLDRRRRGVERLLARRPPGTQRLLVEGAPLAGAGLLARDLGRWAPPELVVERRRTPWAAVDGAASGPEASGTDWHLLVEVPREVAAERRAGGAHFGSLGLAEFDERWERWERQREAARAWSQCRLAGDDPLRPAATLA